jgi:ankyrin repeat protein
MGQPCVTETINIILRDMPTCERLSYVHARAKWRKHSVLDCAILGNEVTCVEHSITAGADVNAQDTFGFTPLMLAFCGGNEKIVDCLLQNGADTNITNIFGESAFEIVMNCGDSDDILRLLAKYAPHDQIKRALSWASENAVKYVDILIECGANANHIKPKG